MGEFWLPALAGVFIIYLGLSYFYIILENRRPKSTLAWLLAFLTLPVTGVLVYFFAGRGYKAFSQERRLMYNAIGVSLLRDLRSQMPRPDEISRRLQAEQPAVNYANLLRLAANNAPSMVTACNRVEILQDTVEFYPRLLEDLARARHHIHLQYYIWSDDEFTRQVKDILVERVRAGVQVRALYDPLGRPSADYIRELRAGGVHFLPYLAYNSLRTLHLLNYRGHRKITIVDGKIGYIGGMNLDREQINGVLWPRWRDTQLRIYGEGALALQTVFLSAWYNTTGEMLPDRMEYFPFLTDEVSTFLPVQITASGPDSQWNGLRQLIFYLIVSARRHVYIQSPFFVPDEPISEAMKAAALSGVDVRIICTPRGAKYQIPYRAANTYFEEMAAAGVKIYLYNKGYYHAKTINMDSEVFTVGSCNMDIRSYTLNYEINAVVYNVDLARELEADFRRDLQDCDPFDPYEYRRRPVGERFVDSVYRLASPLL